MTRTTSQLPSGRPETLPPNALFRCSRCGTKQRAVVPHLCTPRGPRIKVRWWGGVWWWRCVVPGQTAYVEVEHYYPDPGGAADAGRQHLAQTHHPT